MRYLTSQELKNQRNDIRKQLERHIGKNLKDGLAQFIVNRWLPPAGQRPLNILDLGTASGAFAKILWDSGYKHLYAADLEDYTADPYKKLFQEIKTSDLNKDRLPWPDNFFNAVFAWCVLPHLENPYHCSREVYRVLKSGGLFIFSTLNINSAASRNNFIKTGELGGYTSTNNHISILSDTIIAKTMLRNFDLINKEYLVRSKIFRGIKGKIRQALYFLSSCFPSFQKWLQKRWAYNATYILRKK